MYFISTGFVLFEPLRLWTPTQSQQRRLTKIRSDLYFIKYADRGRLTDFKYCEIRQIYGRNPFNNPVTGKKGVDYETKIKNDFIPDACSAFLF